ncbi:GntR family transcriptional regulator [Planomonospora sp. ID82291]|uniref:GntR family transcriptional regulator n=1 Tax=Planomonospora sp. ID82291 TaxID=2738136 RepID=UPI0018C41796|nr:GntR family transcriptional regulator [Planomonospora sp. ID82291]MBG0818728.1 GntR family transcriptional regulator [Planomonospora sp. ID82291]
MALTDTAVLNRAVTLGVAHEQHGLRMAERMTTAGEPPYAGIARALLVEIEKGVYDSEDLPSEKELAARFNVAHNTARSALKALVNQGILVSERGKGYSLRVYRRADIDVAFHGVGEQAGDAIEVAKLAPPKAVADLLPGATAVVRRRTLGAEPKAAYYLADLIALVPELDDPAPIADPPLLDLLAERGVAVTRLETRVISRMATSWENLPPATTVLESVTALIDDSDTVRAVCVTALPGDSYILKFTQARR